MNRAYDLTILISVLAVAISKSVPDDDDLALLAALLVQLGDSLATISIQREMPDK